MKYNSHFFTRKTHRYLGVVIGIQFLLWTLGGLYFSWTDIDEIHGDHFRQEVPPPPGVSWHHLSNLPEVGEAIHSLETRVISGKQYLWINGEKLVALQTGLVKKGISAREAMEIARRHVLPAYPVKKTAYLTSVGPHHEYRGQALPAWVVSFDGPERLRAYISARDGKMQRLRYDSWRMFDFLWMLHIMDYHTRDDINNWILRAFSVLGLLTIGSGFLLFFYSSNRLRRIKRSFLQK